MKCVVQRVSSSKVTVENKVIGSIGSGLNILLGVQDGDSDEDIKKLVNKIVNLRIFQDENKKMNLSLLDVKGWSVNPRWSIRDSHSNKYHL